MFTGLPDKVNRSWILTDDSLKYFVEMYSKTGFRLGRFLVYNNFKLDIYLYIIISDFPRRVVIA